MLDFGTPPPEFGYEDFKAYVATVVHRKVAHRHNLYVPPSSTLLIKTIVTIEGVARSLNPDLNLVAAAVPIVLRAMSRRWLTWRFWRERALLGS